MVSTGKITKAQREKKERDDATAATIRATLTDYYPGKWAQLVSYGPTCCCTLKTKWVAAGGGVPAGVCPLHPWSHIFTRAGS